MNQPALQITLLTLSCLLLSCGGRQRIHVFEANLNQVVYLRHDSTAHLVLTVDVLSNTMNDTCKIGMLEIAPGQTGQILRDESYPNRADSIALPFFSYKATEGTLKVKCRW